MLLQKFDTEIWTAEGPLISFYSFPYSTRMAVIRLSDGTLFVWSPTALSDRLRGEVDALGPVAHIVSPNLLHHFWLGEWKAAYPEARLYATPGLAKRRLGLTFDAELGDAPERAWADDIDQVAVHGNVFMTELVFLHRASRTAIFADLLQNMPPNWFKGWRGALARFDGIVNPNYGAPKELRLTTWRRAQARSAIEKVLAFAPENVIIAHGTMVHGDGVAFIRHGFRWLLADEGGPRAQEVRHHS